MLGLRLRRRQNIKTALGQRLFFLRRDVTAKGRSRCLAWFKGAWHCFLSRHGTLTQRCFNAGPASPILYQHWNIAWSTFLHMGFHPHPPPPAKLINLVDTAHRAIPCALSNEAERADHDIYADFRIEKILWSPWSIHKYFSVVTLDTAWTCYTCLYMLYSQAPGEVFLAQFSLYVHKGDLKPHSFHLCY